MGIATASVVYGLVGAVGRGAAGTPEGEGQAGQAAFGRLVGMTLLAAAVLTLQAGLRTLA